MFYLICSPQVIEYQNAETEFAVAAAEMSETASQVPGSPSVEAKQHEHGTRELVELKVLLGRVSSERDELREETARLRRITSTITSPLQSASPTSQATGAKGKPVVGVTSKRATSTAKAPIDAVGAAANRGVVHKEKQQAATNVLVIELNEEVRVIY